MADIALRQLIGGYLHGPGRPRGEDIEALLLLSGSSLGQGEEQDEINHEKTVSPNHYFEHPFQLFPND